MFGSSSEMPHSCPDLTDSTSTLKFFRVTIFPVKWMIAFESHKPLYESTLIHGSLWISISIGNLLKYPKKYSLNMLSISNVLTASSLNHNSIQWALFDCIYFLVTQIYKATKSLLYNITNFLSYLIIFF